MKIASLFIALTVIVSCATFKKEGVVKSFDGEYYKEFSDGTSYTLILKSDSNFSYDIKGRLLVPCKPVNASISTILTSAIAVK